MLPGCWMCAGSALPVPTHTAVYNKGRGNHLLHLCTLTDPPSHSARGVTSCSSRALPLTEQRSSCQRLWVSSALRPGTSSPQGT